MVFQQQQWQLAMAASATFVALVVGVEYADNQQTSKLNK